MIIIGDASGLVAAFNIGDLEPAAACRALDETSAFRVLPDDL
ncbi:hypothetical protein O7627_20030 [Solwaraspora sp. WMMD1047]|nr:hypothetical protein [Solwaraspora sp. WMMD1047]MDG4831572.1 hypothetical protein [Solwaraspora sp. WMMD1047]